MEKPALFRTMYEYGRADGARRYPSTAGSQAPADPALLDGAMAELDEAGYVVFERIVPAEAVEAVRADVASRLGPRGRNGFEGFATQRLYGVLEKTDACDALVEHPLVLGMLDRILEPNYLLSQVQAISISPGEAQQPLHHDDAFYPWPRPRPPLAGTAMWALDAFTEQNGATVVIPRSHCWPSRVPDSSDLRSARPVVMPEGSLLFFVGTLWHAGGANRAEAPRLALTAQYCAPWCRPQENFSLSVSRERARRSSEHLKRMLGYSIHPPFMGFVNGLHPKRVLEE